MLKNVSFPDFANDYLSKDPQSIQYKPKNSYKKIKIMKSNCKKEQTKLNYLKKN